MERLLHDWLSRGHDLLGMTGVEVRGGGPALCNYAGAEQGPATPRQENLGCGTWWLFLDLGCWIGSRLMGVHNSGETRWLR